MIEVTCHQCGVVFYGQRKSAKFCDDACRNAHRDQLNGPMNRRTSPSQARREDEFFETHMRMCEAYYGLPPKERPAYLIGLITQARQSNAKIKRILTNHLLLRPNGKVQPRVIFWRASSNYPTIAQEAHAFCKWHFDAGVAFVISNPDRKPLPNACRRYGKMKQREYERQLVAIQKKVLPRLEGRPHHTLKAVVQTIVGTRGPILHEEHAVRWGIDLPQSFNQVA